MWTLLRLEAKDTSTNYYYKFKAKFKSHLLYQVLTDCISPHFSSSSMNLYIASFTANNLPFNDFFLFVLLFNTFKYLLTAIPLLIIPYSLTSLKLLRTVVIFSKRSRKLIELYQCNHANNSIYHYFTI